MSKSKKQEKKELDLNNLEIHPYAAVFPAMSDDELQALGKDIVANGLREKIVLFQGKILDGRCRYLAAKSAGFVFSREHFTEWFPVDGNPLAFVTSMNLLRRHLTTGQRADIADKLANIRSGQHKNSGKDAKSNEAPRVTEAEAAKQLKIGRASLQRMKQLKKLNPELHQKVKDGKLGLNEALNQAKGKPKTVNPKKRKTTDPKPTNPDAPKTDWVMVKKVEIAKGLIYLYSGKDSGLCAPITDDVLEAMKKYIHDLEKKEAA